MSYQPEERYWTDYLRIALPVVGLLLMLGLFWYWASNVIGDSGNTNKPTPGAQVVMTANTATATAPALLNIGTTAPAVPTATVASAAGNSGPATEANGANGANSASNGTNAGNTAANTTAAGNAAGNTSGNTATGNSSSGNPSKYAKGDTVTTNDSVNMRSDHSATSDPVDQLVQGTQLNVTGDGVKDGPYIWIPVDDPNTGKSGWVADTFVDITP